MAPFNPVADIMAAVARIRAVGLEPDTIIISQKMYFRVFKRRWSMRGNAHQRRVAKRKNARLARMRENILMPVEIK